MTATLERRVNRIQDIDDELDVLLADDVLPPAEIARAYRMIAERNRLVDAMQAEAGRADSWPKELPESFIGYATQKREPPAARHPQVAPPHARHPWLCQHESGHVVAGALVGLRPIEVVMHLGGGHVRFRDTSTVDEYWEAVMSAAGPMREKRVCPGARGDITGGRDVEGSDGWHVSKVAAKLGLPHNHESGIWEEAESLVWKYGPACDAVADHLHRHGHADEVALKRLVGPIYCAEKLFPGEAW
jgi:hypothetical protein